MKRKAARRGLGMLQITKHSFRGLHLNVGLLECNLVGAVTVKCRRTSASHQGLSQRGYCYWQHANRTADACRALEPGCCTANRKG